MADSQVKQRFDAAVNVIRGLPKNGSYQPSNEMMLRFYAYFKQATLGPCTQKKPGFWDVVSRAKWDAYKSLGKMTQEQAMHLYVEDLKKIIETMSYTDNVAEFMGSINDVDGVNVNDLESLAPILAKAVKSRSNSPIESREASPIRKPPPSAAPQTSYNMNGGNKYYENGHGKLNGNHSPSSSTSSSSSSLSISPSTSMEKDKMMNNNNNNINNSNYNNNNNGNHQNGYSTDHSDDEFIDTVEDDTILLDDQPLQNSKLPNGHYEYNDRNRISNDDRNNLHNSINNMAASSSLGASTTTNNHNTNSNNKTNIDNTMNGKSYPEIQSALSQILRTVNQMNADINSIQNRMGTIEKSLTEVKNHQLKKKIMQLQQQYPKWWPFAEISPNWFIVLIVWPFVVRRIIQMMERKK